MNAAIPTHLLTGFLGSGKTTLLNHLLQSPDYADCAVLVNEFGEIGVDHHLIEAVHGDVVLLRSGCICCTVRGDLIQAMQNLHAQRDAGTVPWFNRMLIETTGLADPTPILSTLMHAPVIRHQFRLAGVLATVDAVNATDTLARFPEALKQVALADQLIITKADLATPGQLAALQADLAQLNPLASIFTSPHRPPPAELLLAERPPAHSHAAGPLSAERGLRRTSGRHARGVSAFTLELPGQLDWPVFALWLSLLLHRHGDQVLRVKGWLDVIGTERPVLIHGVQHLIHPPSHLPTWPSGERGSRLVLIVQDLAAEQIEASLAACQRALCPSPSASAIPQ